MEIPMMLLTRNESAHAKNHVIPYVNGPEQSRNLTKQIHILFEAGSGNGQISTTAVSILLFKLFFCFAMSGKNLIHDDDFLHYPMCIVRRIGHTVTIEYNVDKRAHLQQLWTL